MKLATILPTHYLQLAKDDEMHMALAHLIGKDEEYTNFFKERASEGKYVILDNGVVETGKPVSIEELVAKAKMIGASELIIPDHFMNGEATMESAIENVPYVRKHAPTLKIMVVPQGETIEEWLYFAKEIIQMDIDTIGIPKVLTKLGGRDARLEVLADLGHSLRGLAIHLLGCWENPLELKLIAKAVSTGQILPVRSCDSAIAYAYARENMSITSGERPTGAIDFSAKDASIDKLLHNIMIWEDSVKLDKEKITVLK